MHNEELPNLYASPNIIRVINPRALRWVWHIAHFGGMRSVYRILAEEPEEKRPRYRWEDNIKMDLRVNRMSRYGWIHLAQDRDQ